MSNILFQFPVGSKFHPAYSDDYTLVMQFQFPVGSKFHRRICPVVSIHDPSFNSLSGVSSIAKILDAALHIEFQFPVGSKFHRLSEMQKRKAEYEFQFPVGSKFHPCR